MKLSQASRGPSPFLAQIPVVEKLSILDEALEQPVREPLRNPVQLL